MALSGFREGLESCRGKRLTMLGLGGPSRNSVRCPGNEEPGSAERRRGSAEPAHPGVAELADAGRPVRATGRGGHLGEWPDRVGDHVDHLALALELAVDEQQRVPPDDAPQPRPGVRPERDVDHPGLVLEGEEDRALGRHRVLAGHDQAADPDPARTAAPTSAALVTAPSRSSAGRNSVTTWRRASSPMTA